jgi:hypothetical protein
VAVVTLPGAGTFARIPVPGKPGQVAASVNGRRVLVVSPDVGSLTEIDGIHHKVVRVFRGFGRPVDVVFDYEPPIGLVTPRYAYVLDQARGTLDVLDLGHGQIASRLAVGARPEQVAVDGTLLWVAHADSSTLTRVDVTKPAKPHRLGSLDAHGTVGALVANPESHSVFVAFSGSGVVARYSDSGRRARLGYHTRAAHHPLVGLALAPPNLLIAADHAGTLYLMQEPKGRRLSRLHVPAGIRAIDVYGGWLVGTLPRSLILLAVPDGSMRTSMPFGTSIGGFAWSVL